MKRKVTQPKIIKKYYVTFENGSKYFLNGIDEWSLKRRICKYFPSMYVTIQEIKE